MEATGSHPTKEEGLRLIKEGNYQQAVSILDHVVETDPSDAQAFLYLGVAFAEMGNKAEAIASFEQSVSVKSTARGHFNLGLAYESVERLGEAMTQYQYAARLDQSYKQALDAIERLKGQGIVPTESTAQWTIGAQSVGEAMAEAQAKQAEQTTALPPGFAPGAPGVPAGQGGAPRQYLPGEYEAMQEAKLREHQAQMTKSGLIYGMIVGPIGLMGGSFLFRMFLGGFFNFVVNLISGVIVGAIIGAVCGNTGGGEETGEKVGAAIFGGFNLVTGLIAGVGVGFLFFQVLMGAALGFVVGMFIGRMVEASIGWD